MDAFRYYGRAWVGLPLFFAMLAGSGCATAPRITVVAERYHIDVQLDPASSRINGRTTLDVVRHDDSAVSPDQPVTLELLLHPDLDITSIRVSGVDLASTLLTRPAPDESAEESPPVEFSPRSHFVVIERSFDSASIFVEYSGRLHQDVSAGERPGEIHNFQMRAHVGEDGIYLADGYWYPQPGPGRAEATLADYALTVAPVQGFTLAASGERDDRMAAQTGRLAWRSPYRLEGMALVGGEHEVHAGEHNGLRLALHLKPEQAAHAAGLMAALKKYLDRYEPLIGKYPAAEYTVVDNFFSSGFAFPTFTLLSSAVIDMGERSQNTHGYIDHEMLHSWWGNGIHVDPDDGNWCEALASYGANYYGFILDGDSEEARRKRRNFSHFLSRIRPEDDKPLGTFGREGGAGRSIGYDKGAMVFHMLAWTMGQEAFWSAMRKLTADFTGAYASWEDIRRVCEAESGKNLTTFFDQWVRRGGAPLLMIEEARLNSADQKLLVTISQGAAPFELRVPLRISFGERVEDFMVTLTEPRQIVEVPVSGTPTSVELDPDYHLFREIPPPLILPTTASTKSGHAFVSITPSGEAATAYEQIQSNFANSFEPGEKIEATAGGVEADVFAERCVLVLGEAVFDPYAAAFLSAIQFPVQFVQGGFVLDGREYRDPGDAILATAAHPNVPGGGVTVVYANSPEAVPNAMAIPMYDRSIVVFQGGRAVVRKDLERFAITPVEPM